ncbi:MAG TPA: hypothetical protein VHN78_14420 [Chloroflexota bacterium]|nr:hypothetical protein [Chloroflexota bacterium]
MAGQAAVARQRGGRRGQQRSVAGAPPGIPRIWLWGLGALLLFVLIAGGGMLLYRALDWLYPQELWRYFRPLPQATAGSILYRDLDGQLFLAPLRDLSQARQVAGRAGGAVGREVVRDAVALPDGKSIAYLATVRQAGQAESERLKIVGLDGTVLQDTPISGTVPDEIRSVIYRSVSGRYLAMTNRDRTQVYYYDIPAAGPLTSGQAEAPPEPILWYRNADLLTAPFRGQPAYALSPDERHRAQLREGRRRAPVCAPDVECGQVTELLVSSAAPSASVTGGAGGGGAARAAGGDAVPGNAGAAASGGSTVLLYGAFTDFSAEGWGPVPAQLAGRFYGRVVWSPDSAHLLFTTLDEVDMRLYTISADGKTRPRLLLQSAEALDWVP